MKSIYEPAEDSFLLQKYVKKLAKGFVLDIGTGSGIQAKTAAKKNSVKKVIATDINKEALKKIKEKNITTTYSDLFKNIKTDQKFDTIIFNPPYLPEDRYTKKDKALSGGKKGYELTLRFINQTSTHLKPDGTILLLISSLTRPKIVEQTIKDCLFESKELERQHIFMEDLIVYKIKKTELLKHLEKKGFKDIKYLDKGKRGIIYTADLKDQKVAIKIKKPESEAIQRIQNEALHLKLLNKKGIGPKFLTFDKKHNYLTYRFIEGKFILDSKITKTILKDIFNQCFILDKLNIDKEEMHHPTKHIIITKDKKPIMIDFERCHKTQKPKNVTQFCQFITSGKFKNISRIRPNKDKMIKLASIYKKKQTKKDFEEILKNI